MATISRWTAEFENLKYIDLDALLSCLDGIKDTCPMIFSEFEGLSTIRQLASLVLLERQSNQQK